MKELIIFSSLLAVGFAFPVAPQVLPRNAVQYVMVEPEHTSQMRATHQFQDQSLNHLGQQRDVYLEDRTFKHQVDDFLRQTTPNFYGDEYEAPHINQQSQQIEPFYEKLENQDQIHQTSEDFVIHSPQENRQIEEIAGQFAEYGQEAQDIYYGMQQDKEQGLEMLGQQEANGFQDEQTYFEQNPSQIYIDDQLFETQSQGEDLGQVRADPPSGRLEELGQELETLNEQQQENAYIDQLQQERNDDFLHQAVNDLEHNGQQAEQEIYFGKLVEPEQEFESTMQSIDLTQKEQSQNIYEDELKDLGQQLEQLGQQEEEVYFDKLTEPEKKMDWLDQIAQTQDVPFDKIINLENEGKDNFQQLEDVAQLQQELLGQQSENKWMEPELEMGSIEPQQSTKIDTTQERQDIHQIIKDELLQDEQKLEDLGQQRTDEFQMTADLIGQQQEPTDVHVDYESPTFDKFQDEGQLLEDIGQELEGFKKQNFDQMDLEKISQQRSSSESQKQEVIEELIQKQNADNILVGLLDDDEKRLSGQAQKSEEINHKKIIQGWEKILDDLADELQEQEFQSQDQANSQTNERYLRQQMLADDRQQAVNTGREVQEPITQSRASNLEYSRDQRSGSERTKLIDDFLGELDKETGGHYEEKMPTNTAAAPAGTDDRTLWQKQKDFWHNVGTQIGSAYNKAKEKIRTTSK